MLAQLIGATAIIVAASLVIGQLAISVVGPKRFTWTSGAVGISLMMAVGYAGAWIPGRMLLPTIVIGALFIGGIVRMVQVPEMRPPWLGALLAIPTALMSFLPFLAAGRIGLLGVNYNNDTSAHLLIADEMRLDWVSAVHPVLLPSYPVGPHSIIASLGVVGFTTPMALTAFSIAIPILTATTALALLRRVPWWVALPTITLAALPYLSAQYLAQGAFKETIMGMFLIGLAAAYEDLRGREDEELRFLPLAVILVGIVSAYSYVGLAWCFGTFGLVGLVWVVQRLRAGGWPELGTGLVARVYPVTIAGLLAIGLLAPQLQRIQGFFEYYTKYPISPTLLGNLIGPLPKGELAGLWFNGDFRFPYDGNDVTLVGSIIVAVLFVAALVWWIRADLPALPAAAIISLFFVVWLSRDQSPYVVAKAMVVASPLVFLMIGRAAGELRPVLPMPAWSGLLAGLAVIAVLAVWSSGLTLRSAQIGTSRHADQLAQIGELTRGKTALYLGLDDFIQWELRGTRVDQPNYGIQTFPYNPAKQWVYGQSFDVDDIPPDTLDKYEYVVAPNITSDSEMPANYEQVGVRGDYVAYRRTGPAQRRAILAEGQDGAALLDCKTPAGRRIAAIRGTAGVRGPQVRVPLVGTTARRKEPFQITLGAGTWDIAMRYSSARDLRITGPGVDLTAPATFERVGSVWPIGTVTVDRARTIPLVLTPELRELSVDASVPIQPTEMIAQRRGRQQVLPLSQACGKWVDWYQPTNTLAEGDRP